MSGIIGGIRGDGKKLKLGAPIVGDAVKPIVTGDVNDWHTDVMRIRSGSGVHLQVFVHLQRPAEVQAARHDD